MFGQSFLSRTLLAGVLCLTAGPVVYAETAPTTAPAKKDVSPDSEGKKRPPKHRPEKPGQQDEDRPNIMGAIRRMTDSLNLSDEQKGKIHSILEDAKQAREKFMEEHKDEHMKLMQELRDAKKADDEAKIKETQGKLMALREQAPKPKDTIDKIKEVLTDEQRAKLEEKIQEWKDNHPKPDMKDNPDKDKQDKEEKPHKKPKKHNHDGHDNEKHPKPETHD